MRAVFMLSFILCSLAAFSVQAADEPNTNSAPAAMKIGSDNPYLKSVESKARELSGLLSEDEVAAFVTIRDNFGMIRAVRIAGQDVTRAVKACGKDQPDLKQKMDDRLALWTKTLEPVLKDQASRMDKAVKQNFRESGEVDAYLSLIDAAAHYADDQIDKTPVTTSAACEGLLTSMDRSQDQIEALLKALSWPGEKDS
ncbi:MAG: hypothetical protein KDJ15_06090 [Alphaproteobacteria bacterium]|nr:hypothetical protein [Alphaproteobacteria bacterium]